jgi:ribosomal protein S12 methylthiotransferase accessory factor
MLQRPRFKPHLHVEHLEGEGIFLLSETSLGVLTGPLLQLVAPLIDGRRSADEIVDLIRDQVHPAYVYHALSSLEERGYLVEADEFFPDGETAFWSIQNVDPRTAGARLAASSVLLKGFGGVEIAPLRAALERAHVLLGERGDLVVALTDDYLRVGLKQHNQEALASGRPWLLLRPLGTALWFGPLFRPGHTGCWECLAQRLRINRQVECYVHEHKGRPDPFPIARSYSPATLQVAWNLVAAEIANWIARGESPVLEGKVQTLDLLSWKTRSHSLVRRPQCSACGEPGALVDRQARPISLQSCPKIVSDAGHRAVGTANTFERYQHHVSPITGAVPVLERFDATHDGVIHVYITNPNYSRPAESLAHLRTDMRNRSSGKGTTELQARTSGLCEALERYCGAFRGDEPRRRAQFWELGDDAIHPNACMQFSDSQYRQRETWNAAESFFCFVPVPFDPDMAVDWTPVWSLTHQAVRYLPTGYCYFSYPFAPGQMYCAACSNGCAAGNTLEEAILQGFLELVERDSVAIWWYNRVRRPGVDLSSFDEPYVEQLRRALAGRNRDLWVLDLTADLGIPVFAALSQRVDCSPARILLGFGAHLDPRIALLRAITELNQVLVSFFPAQQDEQGLDQIKDSLVLRWLRTAKLDNQPYLLPDNNAPTRRRTNCARLTRDDLKDEVLACQALVESLGLEMLVLDQTRPDIGLPVVKVIVPGLRHFFARFARGRLYDVPVQLGWFKQPLGEEGLNPQPMFL